MLSPSLLLAGPHADILTMLPGPVSQGRYHVVATATMVTGGTTPAPGAGTGAAIETEIDIINRAGCAVGNLEPVGANLPDKIVMTFFLNLLGVGYGMSHGYPPLG